jgi:hypothetical protein
VLAGSGGAFEGSAAKAVPLRAARSSEDFLELITSSMRRLSSYCHACR